ncbi:TipAS antibiotic-recognition domain-containing protein [Microbacterium sediminicola]|uniref:TipAS antibiotic-recognition domain-containing protein n=1 Tax=Microbacterium sediminicola TaxID=415210 RepID=A0ABN2IGU0_9MICO
MAEWTIHEVVRRAGTTSRTLRHYDAIGILSPTRTGAGGVRFYDDAALVRFQRILLLRELGIGLPMIADILDAQLDQVGALRTHVGWLLRERERLDRQIAAVESTITRWEEGREMHQDMFDGFDHTVHKDEVEQRWGKNAYAQSDRWWREMGADERSKWEADSTRLIADWVAAAERGTEPASEEAQDLARRQVAWLRGIPGTPAQQGPEALAAYVRGLAEMYVADPRFAATYATAAGGSGGAEFVAAALRWFADENL